MERRVVINPLVRDAYLETVRRTIEVAKHFVELKNRYGKKEQPLTINMHMHHGIYITLPDKKGQMYERDFDVYMDYFLHFIKSCEEWIGDADIHIAIENTNGFRKYEKKAIESMLESACFALTWDIGHSKGTGEIDLIDRLNVAKACNARCVLETKMIKALKKSVEWVKNGGN